MTETHIAIVGAGDMGHGFAAHFAGHGKDVTLVDHRQSNIDRARERVAEVAAFLSAEGLVDRDPSAIRDRIDYTIDRAAGVADVDLVLETVTEDVAVKQELFADLAAETDADTLLASNTSGLPITDIAADAPDDAGRIVGCHWWYPPYLLEPVEVIRGEQTTDEAMARMTGFVESVARKPVVVERDVPGFVWNRVQSAVVRECMHLAEEGVASVEDINMAIRDGYARRTAVIGPFETMDIAGLDLFQTVAGDLFPHLSDTDEPSRLFDDHLERGRGGIEDGGGFFEYDEPAAGVTKQRDEGLSTLQRTLSEFRDDSGENT
ncbi:3-hydroxyacyl-CoA dehydrogenase family protein [Haladaptatus sp. DYSN1]|uniref:3-hydroxyacyl-CoA dehydrogenase family protein n=1 Tax=unclassified Haladaptatus TaxID=2622732 RepID=UPI002406B7E4|nr:3-hydroxyacyl-CoA dehydrogenase NAD-binding domain-containing protein [Haladaptatus sp. DYSN1]